MNLEENMFYGFITTTEATHLLSLPHSLLQLISSQRFLMHHNSNIFYPIWNRVDFHFLS
jgi:hypothetical protein